MATITKLIKANGTPYFKVRIRLRGHLPATGTFDRLTDARAWAQRTEASMAEGRYFRTAEAQRHTLAELIDRYIENEVPKHRTNQAKITMHLMWWKHQLGHMILREVTPPVIAEARDRLLRSPLERNRAYGKSPDKKRLKSPATVVHYMAALSHAFSIAMREWLWVEDNPVLKVRKPKLPRGRVRFLSDEERERVLLACRDDPNPYLYTVVVLALSTGARYGEIMNLRWQDVDLPRGIARLEETKNGEKRSIPITGHALELLMELKRVRQRLDTPFIFARKDGKGPMEIRGRWESAVKRAQVHDFRFHDLRHSAASYLAMNGASLVEIAAVLGHKTLQMVQRYSHLSESHLTGVVGRMNARIFNV